MKHNSDNAVREGQDKKFPLNRGPWKTLSSEIKYSNPWISVREDRVVCPDGSEGIYGVVSPKIAVGVVAISTNREVYLVGQYRYPTERYSWELIEGGVEMGEDPLEAAKRELAEEAKLGGNKWEVLATNIQLSNCFTSEIAHLFIATDLYPTTGQLDSTEIIQVKKIGLEQAAEMVKNSEITDSLSMIGILLAQQRDCTKT